MARFSLEFAGGQGVDDDREATWTDSRSDCAIHALSPYQDQRNPLQSPSLTDGQWCYFHHRLHQRHATFRHTEATRGYLIPGQHIELTALELLLIFPGGTPVACV